MTPEKKQEYTRRITQANRTGIIVITYEIAYGYIEDARKSLKEGNEEEYAAELKQAERSVVQLLTALNFRYSLSYHLMRIYNYINECIRNAAWKKDISYLDEPQKILKKLMLSFMKVAESDDSLPLMQNTDEVYAGLTYNSKGMTNTNTRRV